MGEFVFKTTPKGYDVRDAADWQLSASSLAPLLKIARNPDGSPMMGSFTVPDTSADYLIKLHNLDYVPVFWVFDNSEWGMPPDVSDGGNAGKCRMISTGASQYIGMTDAGLYWMGGTKSAGGGTLTGYYYIFQEPMLENFESEVAETTPSSGGLGSDNYVLKITKPGEDITSQDFRDYNFHSGCRSIQVYKKAFGLDFDGMSEVVVPHSLGYPPTFFAWARLIDYPTPTFQPIFSAGDGGAASTDDDVRFYIPYHCDYGIMILKDPALIT